MRQEEVEEDEEEELEDQDFFHIDNEDNMNEDFLYVVKKSLIIDEWKKRKQLIERRNRQALKNSGNSNALGSLLA